MLYLLVLSEVTFKKTPIWLPKHERNKNTNRYESGQVKAHETSTLDKDLKTTEKKQSWELGEVAFSKK